MMTNSSIGFSMWLDFIKRDFLKDQFKTLIEQGWINGATSNPSLFAQAIANSTAYAQQLKTLHGKTPKEKYEALAIEDIKIAAQSLRPLYDAGNDGYISLEVDPFLANDTSATIAEGLRLFEAINEPNVMIKIPATDAGYQAMQALLSTGISVNATLVFSPRQAKQCLKAMKKGIDSFESSGGGRVEAVVSVFVSRFDRHLDETLKQKGLEPSKTGIYNAASIYNLIEANRTPSIRTLFASTGVKGDHLPTDYYIRNLLAPRSVNTAPLHTITAYAQNPQTTPALPIEQEKIEHYFETLSSHGIDMHEVYDTLLQEGLSAFEEAFKALLAQLDT